MQRIGAADSTDVHTSCFCVRGAPTPVRTLRRRTVPSDRAMPSLRQWISRVRAWRLWRALRRPSTTPFMAPYFPHASRPILRDVTPNGVRVYSLCGSCGAHLAASATLCEACARSRSAPNS